MEQKQLAQRLNYVKKYITISYLAQPVISYKICDEEYISSRSYGKISRVGC